jgi:hypothetical protein
MRIDTNKSRVGDPNESAKEREQRGRIEKLERTVEELKKRLPPMPVPLNGEKPK